MNKDFISIFKQYQITKQKFMYKEMFFILKNPVLKRLYREMKNLEKQIRVINN